MEVTLWDCLQDEEGFPHNLFPPKHAKCEWLSPLLPSLSPGKARTESLTFLVGIESVPSSQTGDCMPTFPVLHPLPFCGSCVQPPKCEP